MDENTAYSRISSRMCQSVFIQWYICKYSCLFVHLHTTRHFPSCWVQFLKWQPSGRWVFQVPSIFHTTQHCIQQSNCMQIMILWAIKIQSDAHNILTAQDYHRWTHLQTNLDMYYSEIYSFYVKSAKIFPVFSTIIKMNALLAMLIASDFQPDWGKNSY